MGNNGKLDDAARITLVCEHCVVFRENVFDIYPKSFLNKVALAVYKQCIMPRLRVQKIKSKRASTPHKSTTAAWNEIHARQKKLDERERLIAAREQEISYLQTQNNLANQELARLRREIEEATAIKQAVLNNISELKKDRISGIQLQHLCQVSPQLLCSALCNILERVLIQNNNAYENFTRVARALKALVQLYSHLSQKQAETKRQF